MKTKVIKCEKCGGTGIEEYRFHGIYVNGDERIEPVKCGRCDGFGHLTESTIGSEREEFEKWAKGFMGMDVTPNDSCGYANPETNGAWLSWGAKERRNAGHCTAHKVNEALQCAIDKVAFHGGSVEIEAAIRALMTEE